MKAGVLGVVEGTFKAIDSYTETITRDGHELERCLTIDRVFSLPSGEIAFSGQAAAEMVRTRTATHIANNQIQVSEESHTVTQHAEFAGITGDFVVVESGDGDFVFDLIEKETNTTIQRATANLDDFFSAHDSATPWKTGFYHNGDDGVSGILHGKDLRTTYDLHEMLEESSLNQVGLTYEFEGEDLKMTASRSGYVEVYHPSSFETEDYLEYLQTELLPHVS